MTSDRRFRIAVMPGDGIGREVMEAALAVLDAAVGDRAGGAGGTGSGFTLDYEHHVAGAQAYRDTGVAMPEEVFEQARSADAILFGAMGLPDVRYEDGTEIAPQLDLRFRLGLYAGIRPVKALPGGARPLDDPRGAEVDLVIVRESTEGLFASRGRGVVEDDRIARDTMVITRETCERLFDASFRLAGRRKARGGKGKVTCVDKSNVFASMAFFRKVFDERAGRFPDIEPARRYVDAAALDLVRKPWEFDVMVTENMFGDILSDLAAALVGGMGMAPSGDVGDDHALFQPAHGSAPDIAGQGIANPIAMIQSAAMMLDWLAGRHDVPACAEAGRRIDAAVAAVLAEGRIRPVDLGGADGTEAVTRAVVDAIGGQQAAGPQAGAARAPRRAPRSWTGTRHPSCEPPAAGEAVSDGAAEGPARFGGNAVETTRPTTGIDRNPAREIGIFAARISRQGTKRGLRPASTGWRGVPPYRSVLACRRIGFALAAVFVVLAAGCATTPPKRQGDVCEVLEQYPDWYDYARASEKRWGTPVHVLMAFVRHESSYRSHAKPPFEWLLGVIPLGRPSSAKGYAQAQDPVWGEYRAERGSLLRSRSDMKDALDFIGWYNDKTWRELKIPRDDAYRLYLAYHEGRGGYRRGTWKSKPGVQRTAKKVAETARRYQSQLARCASRFRCDSWFQIWPLCS